MMVVVLSLALAGHTARANSYHKVILAKNYFEDENQFWAKRIVAELLDCVLVLEKQHRPSKLPRATRSL